MRVFAAIAYIDACQDDRTSLSGRHGSPSSLTAASGIGAPPAESRFHRSPIGRRRSRETSNETTRRTRHSARSAGACFASGNTTYDGTPAVPRGASNDSYELARHRDHVLLPTPELQPRFLDRAAAAITTAGREGIDQVSLSGGSEGGETGADSKASPPVGFGLAAQVRRRAFTALRSVVASA